MRRRYDRDEDERADDRPRRRRRAEGGSAVLWAVIGGVIALVLGVGIALMVLLMHHGLGDAGAGGNPQVARMPGLLAYWSFDHVEGGQVIDQSGRKNHATLVGGRLAPGARGQALWLDNNAGEYLDFSASPDFNFAAGTDFTFAGWFITSERSATVLSLRARPGNACPQLEFLVRDGRAMLIVSDDQDQAGQNGVVWAKNPNDGEWHHFAFTRRGRTVELFLDGVSQGQHAAGGVGGPITTDLRAVGCERAWALQNDHRWGNASIRGGIDEVCIFNRAVTPAEIQTLMSR
jgi:hypothetical protein